MFCQKLSPNASWSTHELSVVPKILWKGSHVFFAAVEIKTQKNLTHPFLLKILIFTSPYDQSHDK